MGETATSRKCDLCSHTSSRSETFTIYNLPVNNDVAQPVSLEEALRSQCKPEYLKGNDRYQCECSNTPQQAEQTIIFTLLLRFWFICLKRFRYDRHLHTISKIMTKVSTPEVMTIKEESFRLIAVIIHKGDFFDSGHYMTYFNDADCGLSNTTWFLADDRVVDTVPYENLKKLLNGDWPDQQTPYVLLYKNVTNTI